MFERGRSKSYKLVAGTVMLGTMGTASTMSASAVPQNINYNSNSGSSWSSGLFSSHPWFAAAITGALGVYALYKFGYLSRMLSWVGLSESESAKAGRLHRPFVTETENKGMDVKSIVTVDKSGDKYQSTKERKLYDFFYNKCKKSNGKFQISNDIYCVCDISDNNKGDSVLRVCNGGISCFFVKQNHGKVAILYDSKQITSEVFIDFFNSNYDDVKLVEREGEFVVEDNSSIQSTKERKLYDFFYNKCKGSNGRFQISNNIYCARDVSGNSVRVCRGGESWFLSKQSHGKAKIICCAKTMTLEDFINFFNTNNDGVKFMELGDNFEIVRNSPANNVNINQNNNVNANQNIANNNINNMSMLNMARMNQNNMFMGNLNNMNNMMSQNMSNNMNMNNMNNMVNQNINNAAMNMNNINNNNMAMNNNMMNQNMNNMMNRNMNNMKMVNNMGMGLNMYQNNSYGNNIMNQNNMNVNNMMNMNNVNNMNRNQNINFNNNNMNLMNNMGIGNYKNNINMMNFSNMNNNMNMVNNNN